MATEHKVTVGIVLVTLLMILGGVWYSGRDAAKQKERETIPLMGEKMPDDGAKHVGESEVHPPYSSNPPTTGWHWVGTAGPGIKGEPVADELVLHSMEHGAAVVWYKQGLPVEDVERIKDAFGKASGKKIMLPRENLDVPVALTSWGYLLKLSEIDEDKIKEFIETNNNRAPEDEPI